MGESIEFGETLLTLAKLSGIINTTKKNKQPTGQEVIKMTGFEFAQQFDTMGEKAIVLVMDALKKAYKMAGLDFDTLTTEEKISAIKNVVKD